MSTGEPGGRALLIGVVGVCAAGKSTLVGELRARGYQAKHIAQEHSYVSDMWQRLTHPDLLVFLDASYPITIARRRLDWREADWQEQQRRLVHARQHCDLYLLTDSLTPVQVVTRVLALVEQASSDYTK